MIKPAILTLLLTSFCFINLVFPQSKTDTLLENILSAEKKEPLQKVLQNPLPYRCQIIYTQINRDKHNTPHFKNYYFNYDPDFYFYPASMVKMPLAFLALEKLHAIHVNGVDKNTSLQIDSSYPGQVAEYKDSTSASGLPSVAHYIKKAFLISDNDAYNRMYQFLGQQEINRKLHDKGYKNIRIIRQFMGFTPEQNRHTNQVRFINDNGSLLYTQQPAYNSDSFDFSHKIKLGKAYYNRSDSLINAPMDFTMHNNIPLEDFQKILQSVLFPESVLPKQRFALTEDDYHFLYRYMSQFPSETSYPKYDSSIFYDSYVKFFFQDSSHKMPANVRVFNKVGWAYGTLTDVSYIADFKNGVEYMLAATIYANSDEVLNDDKYDYETVGSPFLYQLGQTIYQHELHRMRPHKPDLSKFKLSYDHRAANDTRASIKVVDN